MKEKNLKYVYILLGICCIYLLTSHLNNKEDTYLDVINKVFKKDIEAIAVIIDKTSSLKCNNLKNYDMATGSIDNDFNSGTRDGFILSAIKELILSIEKSNASREILIGKGKYYLIRVNIDFKGGTKNRDLNKLFLFVNVENNHIIIPKYYIEPNMIGKSTVKYVEFKSTEAVDNLINSILE
ncbi:MAG: hypothetical protein FH753_09805 [Firmicutes bacterium]|nr:hypothetical protein [Bacillota bacterium]